MNIHEVVVAASHSICLL